MSSDTKATWAVFGVMTGLFAVAGAPIVLALGLAALLIWMPVGIWRGVRRRYLARRGDATEGP